MAMQRQEEIAPFAFFDLDAAFAAAFVLIMRGFAHKNDSQKPPPQELFQAIDFMEYLSQAGNNAAAQRLKDPSIRTMTYKWENPGSTWGAPHGEHPWIYVTGAAGAVINVPDAPDHTDAEFFGSVMGG
ncbi:fungal specific transcription factor domain-containing protein [Colletotrichum tofieldiae]|nr:fungal specific transcription factor domain-containing protein [Colletotrichum tofieldiae]